MIKLKFSIVLILSILLFNCTQSKKAENKETKNGMLIIKINNLKYPFKDYRYKAFKIYQNGKEIKEVVLKKNSAEVVLPYGIYEIKYKSIFNHLESIKVNINKDLVKAMFFADKINYNENKNILLIDELNVGETLEYDYKSFGCFSSEEGQFTLTKKDNEAYYIKYKNTDYKLSKKQYQYIREFEIELRSNHSSGCSTIDKYGIYNKQTYESYTVNDESCRWNGFPYLIDFLKLN